MLPRLQAPDYPSALLAPAVLRIVLQPAGAPGAIFCQGPLHWQIWKRTRLQGLKLYIRVHELFSHSHFGLVTFSHMRYRTVQQLIVASRQRTV